MKKSLRIRKKLIDELMAKLIVLAFNENFFISIDGEVVILFERDKDTIEFTERANYISLNYKHNIPLGKNTLKDLLELL